MRLFILIAILLLVSSCLTIKPEMMVYNKDKEMYEYPINKSLNVTLRNSKLEVINKLNYDSFIIEIKSPNYNYPVQERLEQDIYLKSSDFMISKIYSELTNDLIQSKYSQGLEKLRLIRKIYPDIAIFSDCLFLEGFIYEKLGNIDTAKIKYKNFLKYSSSKFSTRFRGNRDFDKNDTIFIYERQYAKKYLENVESIFDTKYFPIIKPKYYFQSFSPGFNFNSEDVLRKSLNAALMFYVGPGLGSENYLIGAQVYMKFNNWIDGNVRLAYNNWIFESFAAVPIQIYRSNDNRVGIKISPVINYTSIDSIKIDSRKYKLNESITNFGLKLSVGYYIFPKVMIGGYYQYMYYNENNKYLMRNLPIHIWMYNEYDLSVYYNIYKSFSLKGGVKNNDLMIGFLWTGWECNYDISKSGLYLKVDMY